MAKLDIAFHASHEQFTPSRLLNLARQAVDAGFGSIHCSDHFHPWNNAQGQSAYAWSWLGASMQINDCPHGLVCAPGQRYHPAIIAQAAATLIEMFGDRLWISLGTGQALNESVVGQWPPKDLRSNRLLECIDVMRRLWRGETVTHDGLITLHQAKLYTTTGDAPLLMGAAVSEDTAAWVAQWADGLTTTDECPNVLTKKIDAFKKSGGTGKPVFVKVEVAYADSMDEALRSAREQWATNTLGSPLQGELETPEAFEDAVKEMKDESMLETNVFFSLDAREYVEKLHSVLDCGATKLIVHNVTTYQEQFLQFWKKEVEPLLSARVYPRPNLHLGESRAEPAA